MYCLFSFLRDPIFYDTAGPRHCLCFETCFRPQLSTPAAAYWWLTSSKRYGW